MTSYLKLFYGFLLVFVMVSVLMLVETNKKLMFKKSSQTFLFAKEEFLDAVSPIDDKSSVTVVSVYIELNKSKHSVEKYDGWIRNMTQSVTSPLAIIVNQDAYLKIKELRKGRATKFYIVEDIWSIMTQLEIERKLPYVAKYLLKQHSIDPEKNIHNPELYALWNLKSYIIHRISQENPFNSKFFIYTDAGAFRERSLDVWPDTEFINSFLINRLSDRVLLGQMDDLEEFNISGVLIQGTFFAGSQKALQDFYQNFYRIHDSRFSKGTFIGKDQTTMDLLAFSQYPNTTVRLKTWGLPCPFDYDIWFYYQLYFSPNKSINCIKNRASILLDPYVLPR